SAGRPDSTARLADAAWRTAGSGRPAGARRWDLPWDQGWGRGTRSRPRRSPRHAPQGGRAIRPPQHRAAFPARAGATAHDAPPSAPSGLPLQTVDTLRHRPVGSLFTPFGRASRLYLAATTRSAAAWTDAGTSLSSWWP